MSLVEIHTAHKIKKKMMSLAILSPVASAALVLLLLVTSSTANAEVDDTTTSAACTPFSQVTAITFFESQSTSTRRRTSNIPTLNCVGNCPSDAQLKAAQCMQVGLSDMGTPSWKCVPQFAKSSSAQHHYGFGSIRVECEGCSKRGDPNIVKGSCALFYSVVEANPGQRRRFHHRFHDEPRHADASDVLTSLVFFTFLLFACVMARRMCCQSPETTTTYYNGGKPIDGYPVQGGGGAQVHHHYGGGYGGGGGGGFGTGMLTGMIVGDMMSRNHYGGGGYYGDTSYDNGGSWGNDGGWGGSDGAGFGGGDSV